MICHADLNERPTLGDIPVRYSTTFPPLCSSLHHILTQSAPHQKSKSTRWPECRSTPRKICNTQSWLSERPFCSERLCVVCPFLSLALYRYFFPFLSGPLPRPSLFVHFNGISYSVSVIKLCVINLHFVIYKEPPYWLYFTFV